jgi:DNA-directed RNA polymerase subunit RPC12/RpoP
MSISCSACGAGYLELDEAKTSRCPYDVFIYKCDSCNKYYKLEPMESEEKIKIWGVIG